MRSMRFFERETGVAFVLFSALAIVFAYPLSLHPATLRFPTGPDGDLGWYILGWDAHAFLHQPWRIFDANMYYPQRFTLAYGENVIGIAFFAAPIIWTSGNLLLAANLVCLLATALCGLGAYLLARRLGVSVGAAIVCGIIWECAPPRFFRIGQMTLGNVQWIPFALAALHAYFDEGRRLYLRLAASLTTLQVLSTGHGAVFITIALAMLALYRFLLGEPLQPIKRARDLGLVGVALLVPAVLIYLPYRAVQQEAGLKRGLGTWVPNYSSFFASPSHLHQFLGYVLTKTDINATATAYLFPGYVALALAVAALVWPARTRSARIPFAAHVRFGLELAVVAATALAGALTFGTLVWYAAGTARLVQPRTAIVAWIICASLLVLEAARDRWTAPRVGTSIRRPIVFLIGAATVWSLLSVARPALRAGDGLAAEYFTNPTWTGSPEFSTVDPQPSDAVVARRWSPPAPDQFSVRWSGFLTVGRSGSYTFATSSDDGSELIVDNHAVVENGGAHSLTTRSGRIHLRRGSHRVTLQYVQYGGASALTWLSLVDDGKLEIVPAWALSQQSTSYLAAVTARFVDALLFVFAIASAAAAAWQVRYRLERRDADAVAWAEALRRSTTVFYAALTLLTVWLALGPPYGLWQFVYWMPGFTFIRANSRFSIVALLGLAVLAAVGLDKITGTLRRGSRIAVAAAVAVLLVAEYAAMPMAVLPAELDVPSIDRWLDTRPKPFVIAEVPLQPLDRLSAFERREVDYMIHSTAHWQKTIHGYDGWRSGLHWKLYADMQTFPDEQSVARLLDLGVTYIVVHTNLYSPEEWTRVEQQLRGFSCQLRLEHVEGDGRVYTLVRPPSGARR